MRLLQNNSSNWSKIVGPSIRRHGAATLAQTHDSAAHMAEGHGCNPAALLRVHFRRPYQTSDGGCAVGRPARVRAESGRPLFALLAVFVRICTTIAKISAR